MNRFDDAMERALLNPRYNVLAGRTPDVRQRLADALGNLIERFIRPLIERLRFPGLTGSGADVYVLYGVFIFAAIAALTFIIYLVKINKKRAGAKTASEILRGIDINIKTADALMAEAAEYAQKGMFREAVRYDFIALLLSLSEKKIIGLKDYKTNGQLKKEVKVNDAGRYNGFCTAAETFNRIWFGNKFAGYELYKNNNILTASLIRGPADETL